MNKPAFPTGLKAKRTEQAGGRWDGTYVDEYESLHQGLSIRDYFAAKAMQGWLATFQGSRHPAVNGGMEDVAFVSYKMADAMMKAREA